MVVIRIREQRGADDGSNATVSFDDTGEYPITIHDPFTSEQEEELEWYFEEHLHIPYLNQVKAQTAASSIASYGETLFKQVFADPEAYARYKEALKSGSHALQFEIAGAPGFHALHWEALKDPKLPHPPMLQAMMVRKNRTPQVVQAKVRSSPTINVLLVTARPFGKRDAGYRTISRPLVEGLRQTDVPVQIDILRPGTYRALVERLDVVTLRYEQSRANGETGGYYHVIHFDVHGALLTHEQLQRGYEADRFLFKARYGRMDLAPYDGYKGFLFLESEQNDQVDLVEASELANLLLTYQIPIAILNACQSGKQVGKEVDSSETSLGSRLIQAGMQQVLAMGYSVTVTAAEILMSTLYQQLFSGQNLSEAICRARQELYNRKSRRASFNQTIDLEDWLLPVVYQNQAQSLQVRQFTPDESKAYYEGQAKSYAAAQPRYGFVGRDLDILHIEKRLLTQRNTVLIRGMGGVGKTTLLHHLGNWWQVTGLVEQVFYFGYDEKAWTRQQILHSIAMQLLDSGEYVRVFQPLSPDAQQVMLTKRLRARRHLLILDNLESITGAHLAIRHTLSSVEQAALQGLFRDLAGGRTLILLGSRGAEDWLAKGTFEDNTYNLSGLDPEAASILVQRILERQGTTKYREDLALRQLLKLLSGFPLALEVVLANLSHQTPAQVLSALQAGDVNLDGGDSQKKTESILRCIDYSHSNLSPEAQTLLLCLAPFTSVFWQDMLDEYTAVLKQRPSLAGLPYDRWQEVLRETENWGLLSRDPSLPAFLRLQPTLPYFLQNRLQAPEQAKVRRAVESAFREHYERVSALLNHLLVSKDPQEQQAGMLVTHLEYENLMTALRLALAGQVSMIEVYFALTHYLNAKQDLRRGQELDQIVQTGLKTYPNDLRAGPLGTKILRIFGTIADRQYDLKQYAAAEASYQEVLKLASQLEQDELMATAYHGLGMVANAQRHWEQAEHYYQQALQISSEYNDRHAQAITYHQLGALAKEQRHWGQAEHYYQLALQIFTAFNDRHAQATAHHNLGMVAQEQGHWEQAKHYYQLALPLYIEYNDRFKQADIYHQLGAVAQDQRQWKEAEQHFQQALQIKIESNDRYGQAGAYHHLGMLAQEQRHWKQAEHYYQQALQISSEFGDRYVQARPYHQLGKIAQEQQRWKEAEHYYQQALQISSEFGDRYNQAGTYNNLGVAAQEQQKWKEAEHYYQQALQIYSEYHNRSGQASTYRQLGIVAAMQHQWNDARNCLLRALETFVADQDTDNTNISLRLLAQVWQASGDADLHRAAASIVGIPPAEMEMLLQNMLDNQPKELTD